MKQLKIRRTDILVFFFSLAIIHGASFTIMDEFSYEECNDCETYLGLAKGDFDQSPVRRYRVIVPLIAGSIDMVAGGFLEKIKPWTSPVDFSLSFSFLIINNLLMALFALLVFRLAIYYVSSPLAASAALLSLLTCRWTAYYAGLPLVDSLYLVVIAMTLLGIRSGNRALIIASIFIGPWAKEAFIFIAPLLFVFAPLKRSKQLVYFVLSGIIVFSFRFLMDSYTGNSFTESIIADAEHFSYLTVSLDRIFSFHGLYELWSVPGFWVILFVPLFIKKGLAKQIAGTFQSYIWWYLPVVLIQMLISTDISRMFYMIMPVQVIVLAIIIDKSGIIQRISAILPDKRYG